MTFSAGVARGNQNRNLREISGEGINANMANSNNCLTLDKESNIAVSNQFELLEEDSNLIMNEKISEIEGNKENLPSHVGSRKGKSGGQVVGGGANGSRGNEIGPFRAGPYEKNSNRNLNRGGNGPKLKRKFNKPTRGLVFGSKESEIELSTSGKHMRVESDDLGRAGGQFDASGKAKDGESSGVEKSGDADILSLAETGEEHHRSMEIVPIGDQLVGSDGIGSTA